jgi:hypothetical protein
MHTTSYQGIVYSVDLMIAYINKYKPPYGVYTITDGEIEEVINHKGWGPDPGYSVVDVLENPKKYPEDKKRIDNADLSFPVIVYDGVIMDGVHRFAKQYVQKNRQLKAYVFGPELMKKFEIGKTNKKSWDKINSMELYEYIILFNERFQEAPIRT